MMKTGNQPLYDTIYQALLKDITTGRYQKEDRLPTEQELAKEFDVSVITVKKAMEMLTRDGLVERIRGKGSFVIETSSQGVPPEQQPKTHGHNLLIGAVISDLSISYGTDLILGMEAEASAQQGFIVIRRSLGQQNIEEISIEALLDLGVDGIIVMPVHGENYNPVILQQVLNDFPIVFVDRYLKGIPAPCACTDNVAAAQKLTNYVLDLGHRNICFLSPPVINTSTLLDRKEGFIKSHAERGILCDESLWLTDLICTMPDEQHTHTECIQREIEKVKDLLSRNPQITCIFAIEYNIAQIALASVSLLGKKVPDDMSIVCFDSPANFIGNYFFTHIRQREYEMGATAVKLLQHQQQKKGRKIFLDFDLIIGTSTKKNDA